MSRLATKDLVDAIGIVIKSASNKSPMEILKGIAIVSEGNGEIQLHATNLEIYTSIGIKAEGAEKWALVVPAKILSDVAKSISGKMVRLGFTEKDTTLKIETDDTSAKIKGLEYRDFPAPPDMSVGENFTLPIETLLSVIDRTYFAASTDDSRPTLTGIEVTIKAGALTFAATDGYRLALASEVIEETVDDFESIIPARALVEFARTAVNATDKNVDVTVNQDRISLFIPNYKGNLHDWRFSMLRIDARFPDYRTIIPKSKKTNVTAYVSDVIAAVKAALLYAKENAGIVRFDVSYDQTDEREPKQTGFGKLVVSGESVEMGEMINRILIEGSGVPISIAFNGKYLLETLGAISDAKFTMELSEPTRPGSFTSPQTPATRYLQVVMPMHPPR